jgi:hypothetical protein
MASALSSEAQSRGVEAVVRLKTPPVSPAITKAEERERDRERERERRAEAEAAMEDSSERIAALDPAIKLEPEAESQPALDDHPSSAGPGPVTGAEDEAGTGTEAGAETIAGSQMAPPAPGRAKSSSSRRLADWDQSFMPPDEADDLSPEQLELRNKLGGYEDDFEDEFVDDGVETGAGGGELRPTAKQFSIEITPFYDGEGVDV